MSAESSVVTAAHFRYVAEHTRADDDFLIALKKAAQGARIPAIQVAPEQASFMQILLKLCGAQTVIEVGTLAGYSAITMARALPEGGHVHTIELSDEYARFAEHWIAESDVAGKVTVHRGAAADVLLQFDTASADAAFLDADKASYPAYLTECMRIVRRGGLIMADNAFAFGQLLDAEPSDPEAPAMRAFNDHMAQVADLHGVIVPLGDGLWVASKAD